MRGRPAVNAHGRFVKGERVRFRDGQVATILRLMNSGAMYELHADTGAVFTAMDNEVNTASEFAPVDEWPQPPPQPLVRDNLGVAQVYSGESE